MNPPPVGVFFFVGVSSPRLALKMSAGTPAEKKK